MKKLKIMNTLCWQDDYVIILNVQIVIIIADNHWKMTIITTSYLVITLLNEMMQLVKNWRRWKLSHLIWKNDFFYLMRSNVSLKREIERWVKRTHSIIWMWKLRKIFNHLVYSLIQAWSGITCSARDPAGQLTGPWIGPLLVDLPSPLVLENRTFFTHSI
jgi:hypothetical protein